MHIFIVSLEGNVSLTCIFSWASTAQLSWYNSQQLLTLLLQGSHSGYLCHNMQSCGQNQTSSVIFFTPNFYFSIITECMRFKKWLYITLKGIMLQSIFKDFINQHICGFKWSIGYVIWPKKQNAFYGNVICRWWMCNKYAYVCNSRLHHLHMAYANVMLASSMAVFDFLTSFGLQA